MRLSKLFIISGAVMLFIGSYGLVDFNAPLFVPFNLPAIVFMYRIASFSYYILSLVLLYAGYILAIKYVDTVKITYKNIIPLLLIISVMVFSYPGFSYDIFNYIATAKLAFYYHENPYIVMPIEIPDEPMLSYMHAANKTALYGPIWIILTSIPFFLGGMHFLFTIFSFKIFILLFYLLSSYLIYLLSEKNIKSLLFFVLNPLVIIETLVSGHNDITMMFFSLLSFYLIKKNKILLSVFFILMSIGIKYATLFLLPVYGYLLFMKYTHKKIKWKKIWFFNMLSMGIIFLLSPIREEMYPWYFQWVIVYGALLVESRYIVWLIVSLSFGLSLRFAPYILERDWTEKVQFAKTLVTVGSFILYNFIYIFYEKWYLKKSTQ